MSRYELILFVHVLAAAAWFGAALLALALVELAARAGDTSAVVWRASTTTRSRTSSSSPQRG